LGGGPHEWMEVALDREPTKPNTPLIRNIALRLAVLFPALAGAHILRSWAGVVEEAPDYLPIIERFTPPEGFVMAMVSGHGFGLCPATGKAVSELVTKGQSSIDIDALGLSRFARLERSWRENRKWTPGEYNT
jgi:sarcosine oxidase, subunit beta